MKRDQRLPYVELANEICWTLCSFCRYADWQGCGCDDGWMECKHPVPAISDPVGNGPGPEPGDDCWGFRAALNVSDMADVVGLVLYRFDSERSNWYRREDGQVVVQGFEQRWYRRAGMLAERVMLWDALQGVGDQ